MTSEIAAVEKVLQVYFDGIYEGDTGKLGEAFLRRCSVVRGRGEVRRALEHRELRCFLRNEGDGLDA